MALFYCFCVPLSCISCSPAFHLCLEMWTYNPIPERSALLISRLVKTMAYVLLKGTRQSALCKCSALQRARYAREFLTAVAHALSVSSETQLAHSWAISKGKYPPDIRGNEYNLLLTFDSWTNRLFTQYLQESLFAPRLD